MNFDNMTLEQIKEKIIDLNKFKEDYKLKHNKSCLSYYHKNGDKLREYQKIKQREYHAKRKEKLQELKEITEPI